MSNHNSRQRPDVAGDPHVADPRAPTHVWPPLIADVPAPERAQAIEVVLTEFRELEAEKRQFAQALLAVAGFVVGADAVLVTQATVQNPLPLVGLAPLTLGALALVLTLRRYISGFIRHLADMEAQLNTLAGADLLAWEQRWYRYGPDPRLVGPTVRRGVLTISGGFFIVGLWAALSSPLITGLPAAGTAPGIAASAAAGWPAWLIAVAVFLDAALCVGLASMATGAAREHDQEVAAWMQARGLGAKT